MQAFGLLGLKEAKIINGKYDFIGAKEVIAKNERNIKEKKLVFHQ